MYNICKLWKRYYNLIHRQKTEITTEINYNNFITIKTKQIMELALRVGESVVGTLGLVDHNTQEVVSTTFSNPQNSSSDENVVTVDSENKVTAVAEGTADVTFQSDVKYTDANTGELVNVTKSTVVTVTITVAPPPAQEVDLVVSFAEVQPAP